jgi:diadenosine tetraphosphatase ApaH/serine/threonine PP2A family protein phosphatase
VKTTIYAIGDIHGRLDLLIALHAKIDGHTKHHAAEHRLLIYLGDYVDRGPDSKGVIDYVMRGKRGFETVALLGNHEQMLLDFISGEPADMWLRNGGDEALKSFGVAPYAANTSSRAAAEAIGVERLNWLRALPRSYQEGGYFFVHAGVRPGVPLKDQSPEDLIWIRGRFTNSAEDFGARIVHGHSPADEPEVRRNRIGIDTGAVWTGRLTAAVINPDNVDADPILLITSGPPLEELRARPERA